MNDYEYYLNESELEPPKPYTLEQQAAIDEINEDIAREFEELLSMG